jgi:hypothetical protein
MCSIIITILSSSKKKSTECVLPGKSIEIGKNKWLVRCDTCVIRTHAPEGTG